MFLIKPEIGKTPWKNCFPNLQQILRETENDDTNVWETSLVSPLPGYSEVLWFIKPKHNPVAPQTPDLESNMCLSQNSVPDRGFGFPCKKNVCYLSDGVLLHLWVLRGVQAALADLGKPQFMVLFQSIYFFFFVNKEYLSLQT